MTRVRAGRLWLCVALVVHLAVAGTYAWRTPAWEGPDENDHAYYVSFLWATGRPPTIPQSAAATGRPAHEEASLAHHPPLYYALLGALTEVLGCGDYTPYWSPNPEWAIRSALKWQHGVDERPPVSHEISVLRGLRAFSVLLGAASIALTYALARVLFPSRPALAGAAALLLACLPQWSWMHGVLDNGNLATALAAGAILVLARGLRGRVLDLRAGVGLGLLLGAALLTKLTAMFLLPVAAGTYAAAWWSWRGQRARVAVSAATALALAAAISGAWFWRNAALYGDPLALAPHAVAYASNRLPAELRLSYLCGDFVPRTLHTTFAGVGWALRGAPAAVEWAGAAVAALGLALGALRLRTLLREGGGPLLVTLAALALTIAGLVQFNWNFVQPQGRYLFPAMGVIAILIAAGLTARPWPRAVAAGAGAACVAAAVALQQVWFLPMLEPDLLPDPHYASYHAGLHTPAARAPRSLRAAAPEPGATLDDPPLFRWHDDDATAAGAYSLIFALPSGFAFATWESARIAVRTQEWALPREFWAALPRGEPIHWRVRRVADRARGEAACAQPETAPRILVRQR